MTLVSAGGQAAVAAPTVGRRAAVWDYEVQIRQVAE